MTSIVGDVHQLMLNWTHLDEDFVITGQDIDMYDPWKNWLNAILLKYSHIEMDFVSIGPEYQNFLDANPAPNPFAVFLFPNIPEVEGIIGKIWESIKDIQGDCLKLMGTSSELRQSVDNTLNNRTIKVLITTPWLFERFVVSGKIGIPWLRLLVCYEIANFISSEMMMELNKYLLHPGTRTSIIISKTFGPSDREVARSFLKPDYHLVYLPYRSLEGTNSQLLHIASTWIASRPLGERIVVVCGMDEFCNELSRQATTREGHGIKSSRVDGDYKRHGSSFRAFNHGPACSVIAIRMEDMNFIDIRKVDAIYNLGIDSKLWFITMYGSARALANLPPQ